MQLLLIISITVHIFAFKLKYSEIETANTVLISISWWQTAQYIYSNLRSKSLKQKVPQHPCTKPPQHGVE